MSKIIGINYLCLFLINFIFISCFNDIMEIKVNDTKRGVLKDDEYDFYKLTLPENVDKNGQIVFELEPYPELDLLNNIISDPNLYISIDELHPNELTSGWKSNRFGDETITISGQYVNPFQYFHIGVHCKNKCNYILKISIVKTIIIQEYKINSFNLEKNTVMKFSFRPRNEFKELSVNVVGSFLNSFNVYLSQTDASSSNTLPSEPIFFNGYKFTITENTASEYNLIVDNRNERQELNIWLKYDNDIIKIKEAEEIYDSISQERANCYYYSIDKINQNKDIIISTSLFNGLGFIYISGFTQIDSNLIGANYKTKDNSYEIIQNRAIRLTSDKLKNFGKLNELEETHLNFCFYAEKSSSLSLKIHLLENYKNIQTLNYIYPGIKIEDILPKKSLTRYRMEFFDIHNDLSIFLTKKSGNPKLFLYLMKPDRNNDLLDYDNFQPLKKADIVFEGQPNYNGFSILLTKEFNTCRKNTYTNRYSCYLNAIVECSEEEDCTYELFFDHEKKNVIMEPKQTYTNVISEKEVDLYTISIRDPSIKNIAIILTKNTGKTVLKLVCFTNELGSYSLDTLDDNNFMPEVIKISPTTFGLDNLKGQLTINVEGLSYASYSLYYYTFNEEENDEYLDQDKVSMKLETGSIIKDIFMDNHRFKVYMYDSSTNGVKPNLLISLIETDATNSELYIFKNLNDFSITNEIVYGYLWKGEIKDYVYIDKDDKNYKENDILYIMVFKKGKTNANQYTTFYLGVTNENTPFLLNEGIEFKHRFDSKHLSQTFFYYYLNDQNDLTEEDDLQISLALYNGKIVVKVTIDNTLYTTVDITDDSHFILIKKSTIQLICKQKSKCPIYIEVSNNKDYYFYSTFLIAVKSGKTIPINLKQGVANKRSILSGESQHFIIDLKPDITFGAKISVFFERGQGEIYARKLLKSELYDVNIFPDENNYEYMANYRSSNKGIYLLEIPYEEIANNDPCKILLTVKGTFPGYFSGTKIEFTISISNTLTELVTDKNYRLFISKGEIIHYHFKVDNDKKRLYISMSNKDQDANMFLNYDTYLSSINEYQWKSQGGLNEFLDLSLNEPFFTERQMSDISGDYYLAIQALNDCFFNLYISTQDVKIMNLAKGVPAGCSCEKKNDFCYFRYENINSPTSQIINEQNIVFYTEYTYGSGSIFGKLYPNGNMEEIINNLPSLTNHDYFGNEYDEFLFASLNKQDPKYTFSSVVVVGVQCHQKSLLDLSAALLDQTSDLTRNNRNFIYLKIDQDNIYYLSKETGIINNLLVYYIYNDEDFNFQIKALAGKAKIHAYLNESLVYTKELEGETISSSNSKFHHIAEFIVDSTKEENKIYFGTVEKEYTKRNYFFLSVSPIEDSIINVNIHFDLNMTNIPMSKEVVGIVKRYNYYAYFDIFKNTNEVIITVTSLEKGKNFVLYLKKNIIKAEEKGDINDQTKYSKPNSKNFDIKGQTNPLTSSVSLRVKNDLNQVESDSIVRVLINVETERYSLNDKIKIFITPVLNNINRIRPQPHFYYFSNLERKLTDKTLFMLKNMNKDDDLMVIEISLCKGDFIYALTDSPPADLESYNSLQNRAVKSNIYSSNGKKIITVENIEVKEYYLMVYGAKKATDELINIKDREINLNNKGSETDILFIYYTTKKKNYNYLVSQDFLNYETKNNYYDVKIKLPDLKKRDILGRENYVDYMNYTFIVTEKKEDFEYMESTCYLTKLMQNKERNKKYKYLKTQYDKVNNIFKVQGFLGGKVYYINILGQNSHTGEIITYNPLMITTFKFEKGSWTFVTVFLSIILIVFICFTFTIYRKYRIQKAQLDIFDSNKNDGDKFNGKIKNLDKINLKVLKKKYNTLEEENKNLE